MIRHDVETGPDLGGADFGSHGFQEIIGALGEFVDGLPGFNRVEGGGAGGDHTGERIEAFEGFRGHGAIFLFLPCDGPTDGARRNIYVI